MCNMIRYKQLIENAAKGGIFCEKGNADYGS